MTIYKRLFLNMVYGFFNYGILVLDCFYKLLNCGLTRNFINMFKIKGSSFFDVKGKGV